MNSDIESKKGQNNGQGNNHHNTIYVNGREYNWNENEISFIQVIELFFGTFDASSGAAYTVAYKRGQGNKPEGVLNFGESTKVKDKMIFNATRTDKS